MEFSPGWTNDDDERPRKGLSKNCGRVVEIELHVALRVPVVFHHFRNVLDVTTEVDDGLTGTLVLVVVRAADEWRAEDDVVGAARVALDAVETDGAAIRNVCVGWSVRRFAATQHDDSISKQVLKALMSDEIRVDGFQSPPFGLLNF